MGGVFNGANDSIKEMRTSSAGTGFVRSQQERDVSWRRDCPIIYHVVEIISSANLKMFLCPNNEKKVSYGLETVL